MNERRKIEDRLKRKETEIQELEGRLADARVYVQALQDVLRMFPKGQSGGNTAETLLRPGSGAAKARDAILATGAPLHINVIMEKMGLAGTRENRASLGSSLAAYVRRGEIFTRPAPNTFSLVELGHGAEVAEEGPPENFGDFPNQKEIDEDIPF